MKNFIPVIRAKRLVEMKQYLDKEYRIQDKKHYMMLGKIKLSYMDIWYEYGIQVTQDEVYFYICKNNANIYFSIVEIYKLLHGLKEKDIVLKTVDKKLNDELLKLPKRKIPIKFTCKFFLNKEFEIKDLTFQPFSIPHDAADPCGFNILHKKNKISIATDLGHVTPEIFDKLSKSSFVLLESNYDPDILKYSKYPYLLKERIAGPNGHLANSDAGKTISYLLKIVFILMK